MDIRRVLVLSTVMLVAFALPLLAIEPAHADPPSGCDTGSRSDFNGDGRSDAVVADPYATFSGQAQAGRVVVFYGDADNRVGEGAHESLSQGVVGVGGSAEPGDRFGYAMAVADLNCDDYSDLVVGSPYEDVTGEADSARPPF